MSPQDLNDHSPNSSSAPDDHAAPEANATPRRSLSLSIVSEAQAAAPPPRYWRSLEERAGDPSLARAAAQEFPPGASQLDGVSRRGFVQLLGASLAVTGAACYRPNQKIVPYVRRPPEVTPGNALDFASAYALEGYATGLVVESQAGRPSKIEGNALHPDSQGAGTALEQALLLGLYDDDRGKAISQKGAGVAWRSLLGTIAGHGTRLAADGGAKLRFLVEPTASPLLADLRSRLLQKFPNAKFVSYSALASDGAAGGAQAAFGRPLEPRHDLSGARVIVSLDADFLADGPEQVRLSRQFAAGREPGPNMNRLYVAEPCPTVTGTMADHRLRLRGADVIGLAQALVAELAKDPGAASLGALAQAAPAAAAVDSRWAAAAAKDLARNRGKSVVIAGRRQPAAVHALVAAINVALGNQGTTVSYWASGLADPTNGIEALRGLVQEIAEGKVDTLVITAENPVYTAPVDFKLDKLLSRVPNTIYLGLHQDETAAVVDTYVPRAHTLEAWGDGRGLDGTVALVQPLITPLWASRTDTELLAAFLGEGEKGAHALVQEFWHKRALSESRATAADFDTVWEAWLGKGVIDKTAGQADATATVDIPALAAKLRPLVQAATAAGGDLEIAFAVDKIFDGRFANNAWLQELPHPITKMTWDNAVVLAKKTADELQVTTGDVVRLELADGRQVEGPAYVQPGHAEQAVTLGLGYGRHIGRVAAGVGFNAGSVRSSAAPWFERGAKLTKTSRRHRFGVTQVHWSMEGRDPIIAAPLADILKEGSEVHEKLQESRGMVETLHEPVDYSQQPYKWAMSIDLNKCTGCSACVVGCQAENNIPVVGRDNVRIGREMLWIRVDRYYAGDENDPELLTQPVMCVHCETAPCEYVCPVNATVHSDEGLNEMVYNRCIGTRYCSNNCPYKARRFNFLDYHADMSPVDKMVANPDVTVRSRGIMEKCTYCVQRIERARIDARVEGRPIADGEVVTACQQVCPSQAITFGSLNDAGSRVSKMHADARRYDLLHELGTRPRTVYLARVRNPNPELA